MSTFSPCTVHWCCKQCPMKSIKHCSWKAMICTGEFWTDQLWALFVMEWARFLLTVVLNARKCLCPQNVQTHFSDCNNYCYYLIYYYFYLCVCVHIYIYIYIMYINLLCTLTKNLSQSALHLYWDRLFSISINCFSSLHKIWSYAVESIQAALIR